jgi:hypothetical protein
MTVGLAPYMQLRKRSSETVMLSKTFLIFLPKTEVSSNATKDAAVKAHDRSKLSL